MITIQQVTDDLAQRAANYGGDIADILNLTPVDLWDSHSELQEFWAGRDLSHIYLSPPSLKCLTTGATSSLKIRHLTEHVVLRL